MLDIRRRTGVLLVVAMMAQLVLISAQVQSKSGLPVFQAVTFGAFASVQRGTTGVLHGVRDFWGSYVWLRGARAENEMLRKQVAELEIRLQEQRALASRSARLQDLLKLQTTTPLPTLAADVIAGNPNPGMWMYGDSLARLARLAPGVLYTSLKACNDYAAGLESAAKVKCPALILVGQRDMMTPPKGADSLAKAIPGGQTVRIAASGHSMMAEAPDAVLDALIDFLR